jgi:hypothetical protein
MRERSSRFTYDYLFAEYVERGRSLNDIANEWDVYPQSVKRELLHYGIPIRPPGEAAKLAADQGRMKPPPQLPWTDERRIAHSAIARAQAQAKPEGLARAREAARTRWAELSEEEREARRAEMHAEYRQTGRRGSKLEHYLHAELAARGEAVQMHAEYLAPGWPPLQVDLLLPKRLVAIEIDGPTHFEPIFGEEKLEQVRGADRTKDGALRAQGYTVVRVRSPRGVKFSLGRAAALLSRLLTVLQCVRGGESEVVRLDY